MWLMPIAQRTSIPNMDLIRPKAKDLLRYHCGCHGNLVTIAKMHVVDVCHPIKPPYQIWTQYDLRQKNHKVTYI